MDKQAENEILKFIEDIDLHRFTLERLSGDIENNQFEIRKTAEVMYLQTEMFLREIYGVQIKQ